jgi:two-component system sensor histidine kinase ChvG
MELPNIADGELKRDGLARPVAALKAAAEKWRGVTARLPTEEFKFPRLRAMRQRPARRFSALSRRIIAINMVGLVILVGGVLYLNQFRQGLIETRIQSLITQGQIIAAAIAQSPSVEREDTPIYDLGDLMRPRTSGCHGPSSINPAPARAILQRLVVLTATRARLYDSRGCLVVDTRTLTSSQVISYDLPPPGTRNRISIFIARVYDWIVGLVPAVDMPIYRENQSAPGAAYKEVAIASTGTASSAVRVNEQGELIVSVALPVQPFRAVRGVLLLSTIGGDIDTIVRAERLAIVEVFLVALGVSVLLSFLLARTIAAPVRRLAQAAEQVRLGIATHINLPEVRREDEIGDLSEALQDMTSALYSRIDAIERFAADVAHEIKNPLTSLRSAVETLLWAKDSEARERLTAIIQDDIRRIDRLVTDISDASRLDAELAREETRPVDIAALLATLADISSQLRKDNAPRLELDLPADDKKKLLVNGFERRLGQVFRNILDNAFSFSGSSSTVRVMAYPYEGRVRIVIEDEGPGIPEENLETIFERFYTQRPQEAFGKNSGLGLSISRQIVNAHNGRVWAENKYLDGKVIGARFTVDLPAIQTS